MWGAGAHNVPLEPMLLNCEKRMGAREVGRIGKERARRKWV